MLHTFEISIPQLEPHDLERRAYLYLPAAYDEDMEARFPVLYMLDGQNVFLDCDASFGRSWRMYDYLHDLDVPVIVAAIESNPIGDHRLCEYSPFTHTESNLGVIEGRGRTMMDYIVREFKPTIDEHFRTLPERECTAFAGSSMGGLMSLYAACHYSDIFSRVACLSPSVWVDPGKVRKMLKRAKIRPDTTVYIDYGENEMGNHKETYDMLPAVFQSLYGKGVSVTMRIVPSGEHSEESWQTRIPAMMDCLGF